MAEKVAFSFGSKAAPAQQAKIAKLVFSADDDEERARGDSGDEDHVLQAEVTSFDQEGSHVVGEEEKKELVIPLLIVNKWRQDAKEISDSEEKQSSAEEQTTQDEEDEDAAAAKAILDDLKRLKEGAQPSQNNIDAIPLLMQNRAPGTAELEDDTEKYRRDVALRPRECTIDEYDATPVDLFGKAMLAGMGWSEGQPIGKTNKGLVEPVEFIPRASGLGLGATRDLKLKPDYKHRLKKYIKPGDTREVKSQIAGKVDASGKVRHMKGLSEDVFDQEILTMKSGAKVEFIAGVHEGHVGTVTRMYNLMVDVRLALSGGVVSADEQDVRVISQRDHNTKLQDIKKYGVRKTASSRDQDSDFTSAETKRSKREIWAMPDIRARVVSESYKKGKYYNKKVKINDVLSDNDISAIDETGRLLEGLKQRDLETIIPKLVNAPVAVVRGNCRGQLGRLVERNKKREEVVIGLVNGDVVTLKFDDVSEYLGSFDEY